MSARSVLLADDHPLFRRGLVDAIRSDGSFTIVAEANDGEQAFALIERHKPRVALLDVDMPKKNGLDVLAAVVGAALPTACVMLTGHDDGDIVRRALSLGAKGFMLKDAAVPDIITCLTLVAEGRSYVAPTLAGHLVAADGARLGSVSGNLDALSPAERRVLRLVALEHTTEQIGKELGISPKTVEHHRSHIISKLGLKGSNALLRYAVEHRARLR
ncbi:MAG: response regulator transcription factor [Gemmatimonadaceae bacterium]|nr:response regulator transcription factor [Gemmatimonadaceae bacterium]MCW5826935.1 response regulator transcription factor [Gemmatimonadaceae bacterium]